MKKIRRIIKRILYRNSLFLFLSCSRFKWVKYKELYSNIDKIGCIIKSVNNERLVESRRLAQNENELYDSNQKKIEERNISKQYISMVENVYVYPETDGIIKDGYIYTDRVNWNLIGLAGMRSDSVVDGNNEECLLRGNWRKAVKIPKAISLVNSSSKNYFHQTFEVFMRLYELDNINEYKSWPLLIDEVVKEDQRSVDLLSIVNVNKRDVIWVKKRHVYYIEELIVPAYYTWVPYKEPQHPIIIDQHAAKYIRNTVIHHSVSTRNFIAKRVFVARGNNERLTNESEVIAVFEKHGFCIFNPDMATLEEEIDCFMNADVVIGCYGAAFTNLLYSKKDINVYMICPYDLRLATCFPITDAVGIEKVRIFKANLENQERIHKSRFRVSNNTIEDIIEIAQKGE